MKTLTPLSRIIIAISALLLISAYFVPLWQILMWAPQYPEGLEMKIWINNITGDVKIISALNHYIGMRQIDVSMFPEFGYMIYIVGACIGVGLIATVAGKRLMLITYIAVLVGCGLASLIDFYMWGYDYGHNLDPTAPIVVPGMSYQPPLIGTKQLLNFTAFSGPAIGGWIFMVSAAAAFFTLAYEIYFKRNNSHKLAGHAMVIGLCLLLNSCSAQPEPIQYGKDACHHCRMTIIDNKFGAEIVTKKGKVFKFDDTSCLLNFMKSGQLKSEETALVLIADFASPGQLVEVNNALLLRSEEIMSPMAGNVAAFNKQTDLDSYKELWKGKELTWSELISSDK